MKKRLFFCLLFLTLSYSQLFAQSACIGQSVVLSEDGQCNYNPWILVFEDEFEGSSLDFSKWYIPYQGVTNDFDFTTHKEWWANIGNTPNIPISNNIQVSNGTLKLIAKKETPPITGTYVLDWGTNPPTTGTSSFDYSSATIESKYQFYYGKYEIRCKLPKGKSFFPAFWMYRSNPWNEIDVFEFRNEYNGLGNFDLDKSIKTHSMNIHTDFDEDGQSENCPTHWNGPDFSQSFHTFTVIWTPHKVEWYVDGDSKGLRTKFYTILGQTVDCNGLQAFHPYVMETVFPKDPMNIIANLAIQSGTEGPNSETPFPSALEIDYIRFYQRVPCIQIEESNIDNLNLINTIYSLIFGETITVGGTFTLEANQQLELVAGEEIVLEPGFAAEEESNFVARIEPVCIDERIGLLSEVDSINNTHTLPLSKGLLNNDKQGIQDNYKVFPNPTTDKLSVEFTTETIDEYEIYITDMQGRVLNFLPTIQNYGVEIDISSYSQGVYLLNILDTRNQRRYFHKIEKY